MWKDLKLSHNQNVLVILWDFVLRIIKNISPVEVCWDGEIATIDYGNQLTPTNTIIIHLASDDLY